MDGKENRTNFFRGGCDIDYKWQVPGAEFWLKKWILNEKYLQKHNSFSNFKTKKETIVDYNEISKYLAGQLNIELY